ncbi:helix-turn-helix domain-containing protein [Rubellicoccus peritrichatus]|uniref:Helix-turn-helix domain-containing protein n=1 Tax=Rubellicoccus peritrichatus TaxID=3080537 RepID=A0AAQ3QXU3_9BACT|nr:helix-turn-helix domain-containing protein [Puniceicoccus sp. CR14]WOO43185.1 helix-turn-helix domain-containing protein [Puniceicoccus sp. CR14]
MPITLKGYYTNASVMEKVELQVDHHDIWDLLSIECLWVYNSVKGIKSNGKWSTAFEAPASVIFVKTGLAELAYGDNVYQCPANTCFFASPGIRRQRFEIGTLVMSVGYKAEWLTGQPFFDSGLNIIHAISDPDSLYTQSHKLFSEIYGDSASGVSFDTAVKQKAKTLQSHLHLKSRFMDWFSVLVSRLETLGVTTSSIGSTDRRSHRLIQLIRSMPLDKPFDKSHIIHGMNLSWRRTEQIFKESFNISPNEFHQRRRLSEAKRLLRIEDVPIKEIAFLLAFPQPSSFTNWFKNRTETSPQLFRNMAYPHDGE